MELSYVTLAVGTVLFGLGLLETWLRKPLASIVLPIASIAAFSFACRTPGSEYMTLAGLSIWVSAFVVALSIVGRRLPLPDPQPPPDDIAGDAPLEFRGGYRDAPTRREEQERARETTIGRLTLVARHFWKRLGE